MKSEWKLVHLGDIVDIKHGFAFKGECFVDYPTPYALITPGNFAIGGGFQEYKQKFYAGSVLQEFVLQAGDLIVTMTDLSKQADTLGYSAIVPISDSITYLHNQRIGLVKIKDASIADKYFVNYLMRSSSYRHWVISSATGSTVKHTSPDRIKAFGFLLPPLSEQKLIAETLASFDDKIELNRKTNIMLEQIAQTLFKSWFVDFDPVKAKAAGRQPEGMDAETAALFPSEFEEGELGLIPKGWHVGSIGRNFLLTMGQSPPGTTYNESGEGIAFFQGRADFGFRFPTPRVYCTAPTRFAEKGDTLVSVRAPVGDVNMAKENCCIGRGVAALRHNSKSRSHTYYAIKELKQHFSKFEAGGTVFGSINKSDFQSLQILEPKIDVILAFENLAFALDEKIELNASENESLTNIRNTLLPKLISGQLRIPDAERMAEAVL